MPVEIKVPAAGESVTEGILSRWLKKDGDYVKVDEPVVELETDKATAEVPAPASGRLRIAVAEGATVPVGAVIGRVEEAAAPAAAPAKAPAPPPPPAPPAKEPAAARPAAAAREVPVSPAARLHAESKGIDTSQLAGSGRRGGVTKQDVLAAPKAGGNGAPPPVAAPARAPGGRETRQRMSPIRQRIAARLVESQQTTASLTTFNEADLTAVNALRAKYKDQFKEKYGVGLGFSSFFVKAAVEALTAYPLVNARLDGGDVVYQHFYDVGVAVSTDKGLMVPVLRDCDRLSFAEVEKGVAALAAKARDGKIGVADLQGGTLPIP